NRTRTGAVGVLALLVWPYRLAAAGGRRAVMPAPILARRGVLAAAAASAGLYLADVGAVAPVVVSRGLLLAVIVGATCSRTPVTVGRDLLALAWIVLAVVMAQAVVGGSAVLTGLNPIIVGFHYATSLALVCVTAAYLVRLKAAPGPRELATPKW